MAISSHPKIYDTIGGGYNSQRVPDARIARVIRTALADAKTVCNVGAGTGAYEPTDITVTAVEPSSQMIGQRESAATVVQASAEELPFADNSFDAALAVLTIHHWLDPVQGLREMSRISNRQVIFTFDLDVIDSLWLVRDYIPEVVEFEKTRAVPISVVRETLGTATVQTVPIPWDCTDGFQAAYWRRPECYLRPEVQASISTLAQLPKPLVKKAMARLAADIKSGAWAARYSDLFEKDEMDFGYRLVIADWAVTL